MKKLLFIFLAEESIESLSPDIKALGLDRYIYINKRLSALYSDRLFLNIEDVKNNQINGSFKKVYLYEFPEFSYKGDISDLKIRLKEWTHSFKMKLQEINFSEDFLFLNLDDLRNTSYWDALGYKLPVISEEIYVDPIDKNFLDYISLSQLYNIVDVDFLTLFFDLKKKNNLTLDDNKISKLLSEKEFSSNQVLKKDFNLAKVEEYSKFLFLQYSQLQEKLENTLVQNRSGDALVNNFRRFQHENIELKKMNKMLLVQLNSIQEKLEIVLKKKNNIKAQVKSKYNIDFVENSNISNTDIKNSVEYQFGKLIIDECKTLQGVINVPFKMVDFVRHNDIPQKIMVESATEVDNESSAKNHLSYKVGSTLIDCMHDPKKVIRLPLSLYKEITSFKLRKANKK